MDEYRELEIATITGAGPQIHLTFVDSDLGLTVDEEWLTDHGLRGLKVGSRILIKGRCGNEDFALSAYNMIEDIILQAL